MAYSSVRALLETVTVHCFLLVCACVLVLRQSGTTQQGTRAQVCVRCAGKTSDPTHGQITIAKILGYI